MTDELDMDGSSYWGDVPSSSSRIDLAHDVFNAEAGAVEAEPEVEEPEQHIEHGLGTESKSLPDFSYSKPTEKTYNSVATAPRTPKSRVSTLRSSRVRKSAPAVHVESVSFSDPLGPLGGSESDDKPVAAVNTDSIATLHSKKPSVQSESGSDVTESMAQLAVGQQPPSTSIISSEHTKVATPVVEQFEITVGDPIKIGDLTSAHTVYTVHTTTTSQQFSKPEASVTRRYRDFRWVYHALETNNPGVIVPPPPEKQAVGRFNEDFVEARRSALANMLTKISKHPILQNDPDFQLFLESDTFTTDIKARQYQASQSSYSGGASASGAEPKGFMSSLGEAFSFSGKFVETDQYFVDKKIYVDMLESQFRYLSKALEVVVAQRKELSDSTAEFASAVTLLSEVELSQSFSELIESFAQTELRIRDLYYRQCMQDVMSLATTLEEYIRLIGSIRDVFSQRQKAYVTLQSAEQELSKKRLHVEKVLRQGKTLQDKIGILNDDISEQEKRVVNCRVAFEDVGKQIVSEFSRFEVEKAHDFRNSVELFLENSVEAQKEAIEIWETFYQLSGFGGPSGVEVA